MFNGKIDENDYYVGVDFGYHTISISYLDQKTNKPLLMDRSGGYGKIYSPSIMTYSNDEDQWLIGEDVTLDIESIEGVTIKNLLEGLQHDQQIEINNHIYTYEVLISIYIEVLLNHLKHLNPKSQVKGLCVTLPDSLYNGKGLQLEGALKNELNSKVGGPISVLPNTACVIQYLKAIDLIEKNDCFLLDFGHKKLRIYHMIHKKATIVEPYMELVELSGEVILNDIYSLIARAYSKETKISVLGESDKQVIEKMTTTYLPYFFKSYREETGLKMTFSSVYPPFQSLISKEVIFQTIEPYRVLLEEKLMSLKIDFPEAEVVMTGNGFHMGWPMIQLEKMSFDIMVEDVDGIVKGAALHAYRPKETESVVYSGLLTKDYGVMIEEVNELTFSCLKYRGTHYSEKSEPMGFVLQDTDDQFLKIYTRDENNLLEVVGQWPLESKTDEGIYRIVITLSFYNESRVEPTIYYDLL